MDIQEVIHAVEEHYFFRRFKEAEELAKEVLSTSAGLDKDSKQLFQVYQDKSHQKNKSTWSIAHGKGLVLHNSLNYNIESPTYTFRYSAFFTSLSEYPQILFSNLDATFPLKHRMLSIQRSELRASIVASSFRNRQKVLCPTWKRYESEDQ